MKRGWKAIATALLCLGCITGVATAAEHRDGHEVYRQERDRDHVRARNGWYNHGTYAYRRGDGDHDRDDGYWRRDRYYRPYYSYRGYYPNSGYYGYYYPYSGYYGYYNYYPYGYYPYGVYPRR